MLYVHMFMFYNSARNCSFFNLPLLLRYRLYHHCCAVIFKNRTIFGDSNKLINVNTHTHTHILNRTHTKLDGNDNKSCHCCVTFVFLFDFLVYIVMTWLSYVCCCMFMIAHCLLQGHSHTLRPRWLVVRWVVSL